MKLTILHMNINMKLLYLAIPFSVLKFYFEKYLFNDWDFLGFLMIIIAIDTIFGLWKYYALKQLSSKGFSQFFSKCFIYLGVLILTHVLMNFTIKSKTNVLFSWLDSIIYSAIIVREAISILENITAINPNILPTYILKRFKQFDDSGNLKDIKKEDDEPEKPIN